MPSTERLFYIVVKFCHKVGIQRSDLKKTDEKRMKYLIIWSLLILILVY